MKPAVTYTAAIPAQKSSPANSITWKPGGTPGTGLLAIHTSKASVAYTVEEFAPGTGWHGRAFRLTKASESYSVFCAVNGQDNRCDCAGFCYGRGKPCKHVLACQELIRSELVNPEADTANTELHEPEIPHLETLDEALARIAAAESPAPAKPAKKSWYERVSAEFA